MIIIPKVKMKKKVVITILVTLLSFLSLAVVNADPIWITEMDLGGGLMDYYPWINYMVTGSGLHIVSDPLFDPDDFGSIIPMETSAASYLKGWVTFICATEKDPPTNIPQGFEYDITVKDVPKGTYDVMAYPTSTFIPGVGIVDSFDLGADPYTLGTIKVGGSGEGSLKGFVDLPGDDGIVPAIYVWMITVEVGGTTIAQTHPADVVDFFVIS
jgi:hypothetical protein